MRRQPEARRQNRRGEQGRASSGGCACSRTTPWVFSGCGAQARRSAACAQLCVHVGGSVRQHHNTNILHNIVLVHLKLRNLKTQVPLLGGRGQVARLVPRGRRSATSCSGSESGTADSPKIRTHAQHGRVPQPSEADARKRDRRRRGEVPDTVTSAGQHSLEL